MCSMKLRGVFLLCFVAACLPAVAWSGWAAWRAQTAWLRASEAVRAADAMGTALRLADALSLEAGGDAGAYALGRSDSR